MTLNFFCPHLAYCFSGLRRRLKNSKNWFSALHSHGIEVILDVVYNHTTEADHLGPTYSFKGIDNAGFYLMTSDPAHPYANFSGTGNTLNPTNPFIRNLILDSLRYWVTEMGVDGFRFDLATILTRREDGGIDFRRSSVTFRRCGPIRFLRQVRLIAEAPGTQEARISLEPASPGMFWHQWNGQFSRWTSADFVRGDSGMVPKVMQRLYGSDDLFPDRIEEARRPFYSINYIIAHDGLTLYDLVSFEKRRKQREWP